MHPFTSLLTSMVSPPGFVGVTYNDGPATTHNLALPSGSALGDLAVAINGFNNTRPTGFTLVRTNTMVNNGGQTYQSSYKILDATDLSNGYVTFPSTGVGNCGSVLAVFRGVTSAVFSAEFENGAGASSIPVTYALNTGSKMTLAYCVDRDGTASGFTLTNATKVGGAPATGGNYGVMWGYNPTPIANSTVITFGSLTAVNSGIACVIDLI